MGMACEWLLCGWLASISVATIQLFLSMWIRSFAIPIGISLGGCVMGMAFYAFGIGNIFPYSLMILGVGSADATAMPAGSFIAITAVSALYTVLFFLLALFYLKKKDVVAS